MYFLCVTTVLFEHIVLIILQGHPSELSDKRPMAYGELRTECTVPGSEVCVCVLCVCVYSQL